MLKRRGFVINVGNIKVYNFYESLWVITEIGAGAYIAYRVNKRMKEVQNSFGRDRRESSRSVSLDGDVSGVLYSQNFNIVDVKSCGCRGESCEEFCVDGGSGECGCVDGGLWCCEDRSEDGGSSSERSGGECGCVGSGRRMSSSKDVDGGNKDDVGARFYVERVFLDGGVVSDGESDLCGLLVRCGSSSKCSVEIGVGLRNVDVPRNFWAQVYVDGSEVRVESRIRLRSRRDGNGFERIDISDLYTWLLHLRRVVDRAIDAVYGELVGGSVICCAK